MYFRGLELELELELATLRASKTAHLGAHEVSKSLHTYDMNCSVIVSSPVDGTPIRSPQDVHTSLLPHFVGKEVIEIGTRNGDGMSCFCKYAKKATAVELATHYCGKLRERSDALKQAGGNGFEVLCSDYRKAPNLDADIFTWWQEPPHLRNHAALESLLGFVLAKKVRSTAIAAMVFDPKFHMDAADYKIYRKYAVGEGAWADTVPVDEFDLCHKLVRKHALCGRARGTFYTLGVPLLALVNHSFTHKGRQLGGRRLENPAWPAR